MVPLGVTVCKYSRMIGLSLLGSILVKGEESVVFIVNGAFVHLGRDIFGNLKLIPSNDVGVKEISEWLGEQIEKWKL